MTAAQPPVEPQDGGAGQALDRLRAAVVEAACAYIEADNGAPEEVSAASVGRALRLSSERRAALAASVAALKAEGDETDV